MKTGIAKKGQKIGWNQKIVDGLGLDWRIFNDFKLHTCGWFGIRLENIHVCNFKSF